MMPLPRDTDYPKFAFLVIANKSPRYEILKRAQLLTWVLEFRGLAPVYYVYGNGKLESGEKSVDNLTTVREINDPLFVPIKNSKLEKKKGNDLIFESVAGWDEILPNTIGGLMEILQNDKYDFLIRTNLSTYWNFESTITLLKSLPLQGVYAGPIRKTVLTYVEGDAIILSEDTALKIIENQGLLNSKLIDDLSLAKMLHHVGIEPLDVKRPWLTLKRLFLIIFTRGGSPEMASEYNSISGLLKCHSIRCKDEKSLWRFTIRFDPIIFIILRLISLHSIYWKNK